jgi:hypothetical protein
MKNKITEIIGWYGVVAILAGYALINFSILKPTSVWYLILNTTGAIGIIIDAVQDKNYQPVVLNIIWFFIALAAIIRLSM